MVGNSSKERRRPTAAPAGTGAERGAVRAGRRNERRSAILSAALDEFAARGFEATRLDDVARRTFELGIDGRIAVADISPGENPVIEEKMKEYPPARPLPQQGEGCEGYGDADGGVATCAGGIATGVNGECRQQCENDERIEEESSIAPVGAQIARQGANSEIEEGE